MIVSNAYSHSFFGGNKMTKNNITEIIFILDRSGSMSGLEKDTIGGFNSLIEKQKKQDGECYVSTVLFNNERKVIHDRLKLKDVEKMTEKDYEVYGSTALMDAIGCSIHHVSNIHKYARPEDVPQQTMFVITTDGYENASHIYSSDEVKKMIEDKKKNNGWQFIFIGANIDAVETAKTFGINSQYVANYHADKIGTQFMFNTISKTVSGVRSSEGIKENWNSEIQQDYNSRKAR